MCIMGRVRLLSLELLLLLMYQPYIHRLIYWFLIIFGIFTLSISVSNQVYNLVVKKYITVNLLFQILIRISLFFVATTHSKRASPFWHKIFISQAQFNHHFVGIDMLIDLNSILIFWQVFLSDMSIGRPDGRLAGRPTGPHWPSQK